MSAPTPSRDAQAGFSLVALLAAVTIMLILMGAAVPTWKYVMKDAREEELLFRGIQIAEAIERWQRKHGNAPPPDLKVLVDGHFLRKPYKDPMTRQGKWRFIRQGEPCAPSPLMPPGGPPVTQPPGAPAGPGMTIGGILGVATTSKEKSLRIFNGRTKYSEWLFCAGQPRVIGRQPGPVPLQPGGAPGVSAPPPPR